MMDLLRPVTISRQNQIEMQCFGGKYASKSNNKKLTTSDFDEKRAAKAELEIMESWTPLFAFWACIVRSICFLKFDYKKHAEF